MKQAYRNVSFQCGLGDETTTKGLEEVGEITWAGLMV